MYLSTAIIVPQGWYKGIALSCCTGSFLGFREVPPTHNCLCVEPCQRESFGAEAARGNGNRLVEAWCFKAFLIRIAQCRAAFSNDNPPSFNSHRPITHFEYPPPLEAVRLNY